MISSRTACWPLLALGLLGPGAALSQVPAAERLARADELFRAREYSEALAAYEGAERAARSERDRTTRVEALSQQARMLSLTGRLDEGRAVLARAAGLARSQEALGWTRYLGVRGIFERETGRRAAALRTFERMYADATAAGLHLRAIDAAHHAAIVAPAERQVAWALRGIAAAEAAGSESWLAVLWNNLGATHDWDLEDYPRAVECYRKARHYHHRTGGPQQRLAADWALGRAALLAGDVQEASALLPDALEQARARHAAEPTKETREWLGYAAQWQGELLARTGRPTEGAALMAEAREALLEAGIREWWPEGLAELEARLQELSPR